MSGPKALWVQTYLMANLLLRVRLLPEHVKPRSLGHWGTTPGASYPVSPGTRDGHHGDRAGGSFHQGDRN